MILPLASLLLTAPMEDDAEKRLAKLRSAYANVRSAQVQTSFRKVWESETSPAVEIDTVTYFERPNRIRCVATRRGEPQPFLTYVTDGRTYRRVENGQATSGDFDPGETLPRAGVTLETLALWTGDAQLKPGSRLLPHPLTTNVTPVVGPDGRGGWSFLAMARDEITMYLDPKTGLIGTIAVGSVFDRNTGERIPRYAFRVTKWTLGVRYPKAFFDVPKDDGAPDGPAKGGGKDGGGKDGREKR